jgi:hypothetical protein
MRGKAVERFRKIHGTSGENYRKIASHHVITGRNGTEKGSNVSGRRELSHQSKEIRNIYTPRNQGKDCNALV